MSWPLRGSLRSSLGTIFPSNENAVVSFLGIIVSLAKEKPQRFRRPTSAGGGRVRGRAGYELGRRLAAMNFRKKSTRRRGAGRMSTASHRHPVSLQPGLNFNPVSLQPVLNFTRTAWRGYDTVLLGRGGCERHGHTIANWQ